MCNHKFKETSEDSQFIYVKCIKCGTTNCRSHKANNKYYKGSKKL